MQGTERNLVLDDIFKILDLASPKTPFDLGIFKLGRQVNLSYWSFTITRLLMATRVYRILT